MSPGDVVSICPSDIRFKLSYDLDLGGVRDGDWDIARRVALTRTAKHKSIMQRYVDGLPWLETDLFRGSYANRFKAGKGVRGTVSLTELAAQYDRRVDAMFASLKEDGFREVVDGRAVPLPKVHIGRDGEIILGNQGNHRLAMAKVLGLAEIKVKVHTRHADYRMKPELPECAAAIPAMTNEAERLAYYRLAHKAAEHGEVVELGAWLGAATAYLAAAMRDSGWLRRVRVYDRFVWDPSHKAKGAKGKDMLGQFEKNLGPLMDFVDAYPGEIADLTWWADVPVSMIVFDAPKRVREISIALTKFAPAVRAGTILAWQDFAHFPSYDIPACLTRLGRKIEYVEGVYPGSTAVFRVIEPWTAEEVSRETLDLKSWPADGIEKAWDRWAAMLPEPMRPRFQCGSALFLCDNGHVDRAKERLRTIVAEHADAVMPKWRKLERDRLDLVQRYRPLFEMLAC